MSDAYKKWEKTGRADQRSVTRHLDFTLLPEMAGYGCA
jgi:hypothetical protein